MRTKSNSKLRTAKGTLLTRTEYLLYRILVEQRKLNKLMCAAMRIPFQVAAIQRKTQPTQQQLNFGDPNGITIKIGRG